VAARCAAVIKDLTQAGIGPSVIAGTSAGSLVGAALAADLDWRELTALARSIFWLSGVLAPAFHKPL
jgi:predicted acylesterase/phospholipase RssA